MEPSISACLAVELNSTIATLEPVPFSAFRSPIAAARTSALISLVPEPAPTIEPDSSNTNMMSSGHAGVRSGLVVCEKTDNPLKTKTTTHKGSRIIEFLVCLQQVISLIFMINGLGEDDWFTL